MSFRELRNFTEIMRALGYPRLVSMENFRQPNFELVADCLYWLVQRYDPKVDIGDDISTEADRVHFLKSVAQLMATKGRVKLNCKRLYAADGYAVKELLKVADVLYQAMLKADDVDEEPAGGDVPLSSKAFDVRATRQLASEITQSGAGLYDALEQEAELRDARAAAVGRNMDLDEVAQFVKEASVSVQENVDGVNRMLDNLDKDQKQLVAKIEKRKAELERCEKRLATLQNVRPAYMDEYEVLQRELQELYEVYLERFRNLRYLQAEIKAYDNKERERMEESEKALKKMQKRLRAEEMRILRGEDAVDEGNLDFDDASDDSSPRLGQTRKKGGRGSAGGGGKKLSMAAETLGGDGGGGNMGSLMGGADSGSDDDALSDDGGSGAGSESTHVSLNDGELTDDLIEDDDEDEMSDVDDDEESGESDNEF